jgi:hypothetical protein
MGSYSFEIILVSGKTFRFTGLDQGIANNLKTELETKALFSTITGGREIHIKTKYVVAYSIEKEISRKEDLNTNENLIEDFKN